MSSRPSAPGYERAPPCRLVAFCGTLRTMADMRADKGGQARLKFLVTLVSGEDGFIVAECPALPGCLSQGRTASEALSNIREAIEASLLTRRELKLDPGIEVAEVEVTLPA